MKRSVLQLAATALAIIAIASLSISGASARSDLATATAATARFHSLSQADAAGYGQPPAPAPLHECISSFNNTGSMGFHYINGGLLDADVDVAHPEVLVYAPDKHGKRKLVALEYVVFQGDWIAKHGDTMPELFGEMFMATGAPNRYAIPAFFSLHVWLYQDNPAGLFAPFNPSVSCAGAEASATSVRDLAARIGTAQFACGIPSKRA